PGWLELASKYLYDGIDGREWGECLDIWMAFEKEAEVFRDNNSKLYPQILSKWLQNHQYQSIPTVENIETYTKEWLTWWNSLQPKWQQSTVPNTLPPSLSTMREKENMLNLKKGGPLGLVTFLIALKWW
ncbi:hypothetical protein BYT27DRAFT_7037169, partial [Phlegmacium glaucopus]